MATARARAPSMNAWEEREGRRKNRKEERNGVEWISVNSAAWLATQPTHPPTQHTYTHSTHTRTLYTHKPTQRFSSMFKTMSSYLERAEGRGERPPAPPEERLFNLLEDGELYGGFAAEPNVRPDAIVEGEVPLLTGHSGLPYLGHRGGRVRLHGDKKGRERGQGGEHRKSE